MSTQRKKIVAAVTAALLHHEHICATVGEVAQTAAAAPAQPPAGFGAVCLPAPSAWAFAGRFDHMAQRVQRQVRRAG